MEKRPDIRIAPDTFVAYGRPQWNLDSYRVWEEGGIFPQIITEVLSWKHKPGDMECKREFYQHYGCEEYIEINPFTERLSVWLKPPDSSTLKFVPIQLLPRPEFQQFDHGANVRFHLLDADPFQGGMDVMLAARKVRRW